MGEKRKAFSGTNRTFYSDNLSVYFWSDGVYASCADIDFGNISILGDPEERRWGMNTEMILPAVLISAMITFALRLLPFVIFRNEKELPDTIKRLGEVLPSAIMAILIIYCLKDVGDNFMADGVWRLVAVTIVAVSYKWKHNTLLSILLGTVCYMLLLHI